MSETGSLSEAPTRRIFSVSEINQETKKTLEQRFFSIFIRGEVSNFSSPRSGHWYFTLKDESAQIRVVMFKQANFRHQAPKLGDELIVSGQLSFYRERGEVQIIANQIRPAGLGDLQQQFEALKKKLLDEGLFDQTHKALIPEFPRKVAVITSPTGAVVQDIARVCERRAASLPLLVVPVRVQGLEAENEICRALDACNEREDLDLIIVARGGGSLEDLVAFNSENVARAIFASRLPVISAVGHETDVSIADFVADRRAATPTEAAEFATIGYEEIQKRLSISGDLLQRVFHSALDQSRNRLETLKLQIKNPADELRQVSQSIDFVESKLYMLGRSLIDVNRSKLSESQSKLTSNRFLEKQKSYRTLLDHMHSRLTACANTPLNTKKIQLTKAISLLEAINPLSTMTRGYSIAVNQQGTVIDSVAKIKTGEKFEVRLTDGKILSRSEDVLPDAN